jgi:hypothetical protein
MDAEIQQIETTEQFKTLTVIQQEKIRADIRAKYQLDDQAKKRKALEDEANIYKQYIDITTKLSQDAIEGNGNAFKEFAKSIILMALDQLKLQTEMAIAGATIQSLATPDSILTFGASGLARAAILVGLIEAAFAGIKGVVGKAINGFAEGGRTDSVSNGGYVPNYKIATFGERGPEYVIPNEALQNPYISQFIDAVEVSRKMGTLRNFDYLNMAYSQPQAVSKFAAGGFTNGQNTNTTIGGIDTETKALLYKLVQLSEQNNQKEYKAKVVYTEFETVQNNINTIRNNSKIK